MTDDATAILHYKDFRIDIYTPFSDYWIQRTQDCPEEIFWEVIAHLESSKTRWWNRISWETAKIEKKEQWKFGDNFWSNI